MRQITQLLIQDRDNTLLAILDPFEAYTCEIDQQINGYDTLTIVLDVQHNIAQYAKKGNRIMMYDYRNAEWLEYVINGLTYNGYTVQLDCESSLYDTYNSYIQFIDITGNLPITGLEKIFTTAYPKSNWNVGRSDITGTYQMQRTRYSLFEVLHDWTAKVNGEIKKRIEIYNNRPVRYFDILTNVGKNIGKVLYDDRDLADVNIEIPVNTIYTAAYGSGATVTPEGEEEGKPITFKDVEWTVAKGNPVNKPLGQEWVALPDLYKQKFGYFDTNGVLQNPMTMVKEDGVKIPSELLQRTYDFLLNNVKDNTIYKLSAIDLAALNLDPLDIAIGDVIGAQIVNLDFLFVESKVMRYKEDLINAGNNDFELENLSKSLSDDIIGNDRKLEDIQDAITGIQAKPFVTNVLNKWNEEINKDAGYLLYADPQDGLVAYNAPTAQASTKATQMKGGSLRIANTKTGGEFNWTTVMTGDGIIATRIYTGIIQGNLFDLDLDSGVVRMGKRNASGVITDPWLYFAGDSFVFKPLSSYSTTEQTNAAISLSAAGLKQEFSTTISGALSGANNLMPGTGFKTTDGLYFESSDGAKGIIDARNYDFALSGRVATLEIISNGTGRFSYNKNRYMIEKGKTYSISCGITISLYPEPPFIIKAGIVYESDRPDSGLEGVKQHTFTTNNSNVYKLEHTFTALGNSTFPPFFMIEFLSQLKTGNLIILYDIKFTESAVITPWTPAAEDLTDALDGYATIVEMNTAINTSAAGIEIDINKKLLSYSSTSEMNTAIKATADGITASFNSKLTNYSTTTQMNTSIQASATGITTTISNQLSSGTGKIQTTKFIMDISGFTVKNGAIKIQNNAGVNVLYGDAYGDIIYAGAIEQQMNGNLTLRIRNSTIDFYAPNYTNNFVGFIGAQATPQGQEQGIIIGHDNGDILSLSKKSGGGYSSQMKFSDSGIQVYDRMYFEGGGPWVPDLHGRGGYQLGLYSNEFVICRQEANSANFIPIYASSFIQACKEELKRGIKEITKENKDPYKVLEETDFYSFYTKHDLRTSTFRNESENGVSQQGKTIAPVIGENYRVSKELVIHNCVTGEIDGVSISNIANIAAAHTKQLKIDTDKEIQNLKQEIQNLKQILGVTKI